MELSFPMLILAMGLLGTLGIGVLAFAGPSSSKASTRQIGKAHV